MSFELPKLGYELDALEPYINKKTFEFHYGKHHQAYVNNLNLVQGTKFENATLEEIIQESNAGNPLRDGLTPILTCDVWERLLSGLSK